METKYKTASDIKDAPLIGRDSALQELQGYFSEIGKGTPKFIVITGDQGLGKTRLVKELMNNAKEQNSNVEFVEEVARPADEQVAFGRVIHLFLQLKHKYGVLQQPQYRGNPPPMLKPDFIEFAISTLDQDHLLNIYSQVESDLAKIYASARAYLLSHAYRQPLCIVWEDLHHLDRESADFLLYLGDALEPGQPLLNIGLYRGEERSGENNFQRILPRLRSKSQFCEIKLSPILARDTIPFLRGLIGPMRIDHSEAMPLYRVTSGNPYHLIEFVRGMAEQGKIQWQDGAWQLEISRDLLTRPPKGVEEQLILNLGRLGSNNIKVLENMAIASTPLSDEFLGAFTGLKAMQLSMVLTDLLKERYIIQDEENKLYAISSSNIEAEVLKRLDEKQQQKMHLQFAKAWEKKSGTEESTLKLADHFLKGEDLKKSLSYSLEAGRWLVKEKRLRLALKYYRQALKLARDVKSKLLFEVLAEMGFLLANMGSHKEALAIFDDAKGQAAKPEETFQVLKGRGLCFYGMRKNAQALKEFKDATRIPQKEKDAEMLLYQVSLDIYRFQLKKARASLAEAETIIGNRKDYAGLRKKQEGLLQFYLGNWKEAQAALKAAEDHYTELQSNQDIVEILLGKAYLLANTQSLDKANELLQEAFTLLQGTEDWLLEFQVNYEAGLFAWEQREIAKAREYFQKLETIAKKGSEREVAFSVLGMGLCALQGKLDTAQVESLAQKVLELSNTFSDKFLAAEAYYIMARMYMFTKQFPDAIRYLDYSGDAYRAVDMAWKANRLSACYARIHTLTKQPKKGLDLLVESEKQARVQNDISHIADNYFERGFLMGFNRKFAEAAQWFHKAGEIYLKLGKRASVQDAKANEDKCLSAVPKGE